MDSWAEMERQSPVAYIEIDRFCDSCGYNLRTQPIRLEPQTELLLCRCPECGKFQNARDGATAGRVWLRRLGTLALLLWVIAVLAAGVGLVGGQIGITLAVLEELTTHRRITPVAIASQPAPTTSQALGVVPLPGLSQTITIDPAGNIITTTTGSAPRTRWRRELREQYEPYLLFISSVRAASFALGFVLATFAVVVMHHWRRWGYFIPVIIVPLFASWLVWYFWRLDHPHLADWAAQYVSLQGSAHLVGGVLGIYLGRPFARLIVSLVLPPRVRQVVAFLWLADGKKPPSTA